MADLDLLRAGYALRNEADLYRRWARSNPGEQQKYETFVNEILAGKNPAAPTLATATGRMLVLQASMALPEGSQPPRVPSPISGLAYSLVYSNDFSSFAYNSAGPWSTEHYRQPSEDAHHAAHIYADAGRAKIQYDAADARDLSLALRATGSATTPPRFQFGFFETVFWFTLNGPVSPAWWMISDNPEFGTGAATPATNLYGEIDMMEIWPANEAWGGKDTITFNLHRNTSDNFGVSDEFRQDSADPLGTGVTLASKWIKLGLLWPDNGTDLKLYFAHDTSNNTAAGAAAAPYTEIGSHLPYDSTPQPMTMIYYIWNAATHWGHTGTQQDNSMLIDYVKVWQKAASGGSVPGAQP